MSKDFTAENCASSDTPGMQSAAGRKEGKPVTDIASLHRPIRLANYQAGHPSGQGLRLLPDLVLHSTVKHYTTSAKVERPYRIEIQFAALKRMLNRGELDYVD